MILGVICTTVLLQVKKHATFCSCSTTHILSESLCVHMMNILDKLNIRFLNVQAINFQVTFRFDLEYEQIRSVRPPHT